MIGDRTPKSGVLWTAAKEVVQGGLLSAARNFKPYPFFTDRAQGSRAYDVDGNSYIDCCMNVGALILGHRPAAVMTR